MLSQYGEAEGVDVSDDALEFCRRKGLKGQKGLAETLPYEDETFDLTTALDVVEHLDDDIAGLKEMFRVTKSGGYSLIFVPAFMWLWGVQDDISNHRIRYTKKQIVDRLKKAGYTDRACDVCQLDILHTDPRRPDDNEAHRHQARVREQHHDLGAQRHFWKTIRCRAVLAEEFQFSARCLDSRRRPQELARENTKTRKKEIRISCFSCDSWENICFR